jgi:hypothetical protein
MVKINILPTQLLVRKLTVGLTVRRRHLARIAKLKNVRWCETTLDHDTSLKLSFKLKFVNGIHHIYSALTHVIIQDLDSSLNEEISEAWPI